MCIRDSKEALQVLSEKTISLIVSDVMMPEMDGFELCHTLKTDIEHSHIPIILLTAKVTMQSKIEGIELGADDYIEKPFSTEYLLARIANLLSNQDKLRHAFTSSPFVNAKTIALSKADENFLDKLIEVIPVSYTHLDVYKRQLYNHETNDFTRIHKMDGIFVFNILEDSKGNIWFATYNSGIFKYNPRNNSWKNYVSTPGVPHGLPYNKVISIYEDSKQRLWFTMLGRGFCSFNQDTEEFTTYDSSQGRCV